MATIVALAFPLHKEPAPTVHSSKMGPETMPFHGSSPSICFANNGFRATSFTDPSSVSAFQFLSSNLPSKEPSLAEAERRSKVSP